MSEAKSELKNKKQSLEERINDVINDGSMFWFHRIEDISDLGGHFYKDRVNQMIQNAPLEIALTSPSAYIREYRKLYEECLKKGFKI